MGVFIRELTLYIITGVKKKKKLQLSCRHGSTCSLHLLLYLWVLHALPLQEPRRDDGDGCTCQCHPEAVGEARHVRLQCAIELVQHAHRGQRVSDLRRADGEQDIWIQTGHEFADAADESVLEDGLGDGDEERAAEGLEEHDAGRADGDVIERETGLDGEERDLEHESDAGAGEDLVPEPLGERGGGGEGGEEPGADGEEDGAGEGKGDVLADDGDETARDHGEQDAGEEEREDVDAGFDGGCAFDGLEVEREVEDEGEEGCAEGDGEADGCCDGALGEDARGEGGAVAEFDLGDDEDADEAAEADEEADDA